MEETKLTISINGQYNNITLNEKETLEVDGVGKITLPILREEKFIVVEKVFEAPREIVSTRFFEDLAKTTPKVSYLYRVKYEDKDVSFFINKKKEADALNVLGRVGSKIKITAELYDTKSGGKAQNLSFELME